ncbi:hypothetical protein ACFQT0_01965 [Hymenobacter humi]|uniref:Uncharacterized protein n=1 Tax=Hymenobacter humi TaxID=1411620 RepID=A0ABW2U1T5_9BACT
MDSRPARSCFAGPLRRQCAAIGNYPPAVVAAAFPAEVSLAPRRCLCLYAAYPRQGSLALPSSDEPAGPARRISDRAGAGAPLLLTG